MPDDTAAAEMPKYKCHKEVHALKIEGVRIDLGGYATLTFEDKTFAPRQMPAEWNLKFRPKAGGYYVVYKDGYTSWSPGDVFEAGYTKL